ncbi:MAG: hypothetical protein MUC83_11235, partial [Pirellula sp.]|nr:hypothetical protein [Pirellula sp.]
MRRRAFCLAFVFVWQPAFGFGFEETNKSVSSDAFEIFLRSKNIVTVSPPKNTDKTPQLPPATQPFNSQTGNAQPISGEPQSVPSMGLFPPTPDAIAPTTPALPIAKQAEPVAAKSENSTATSATLPLPHQAPLTANVSPTSETVSAQPGVEQYIPCEADDLAPYEWGGCWWEKPHALNKQLITRDINRVQFIDLEQLVWLSVQHSPAIKAIIKVPSVQRSEEDVARSEFDPRFNARSNFKDTSDPVGNTLTTGGPNRLNEYFWENSVGISDRNTFGGRTELRQAMDARDSNSLFFIPGDQVDTKLSLNYTQPLR